VQIRKIHGKKRTLNFKSLNQINIVSLYLFLMVIKLTTIKLFTHN